MSVCYSKGLLQDELAKEVKARDFNAEWFAEKGGSHALRDYEKAIRRIEDLEHALRVLNEHGRGTAKQET